MRRRRRRRISRVLTPSSFPPPANPLLLPYPYPYQTFYILLSSSFSLQSPSSPTSGVLVFLRITLVSYVALALPEGGPSVTGSNACLARPGCLFVRAERGAVPKIKSTPLPSSLAPRLIPNISTSSLGYPSLVNDSCCPAAARRPGLLW